MNVSLAWSQLVREKRRLLVAVAGISFVVLLVFVQLSFQDALYDSATRLHRSLRADVVLISPQYQYLLGPKSFTRRRLYQAMALEGVESVAPIQLGFALWKQPQTGRGRMIMLLGIAPASRPLDLPQVQRQADLLKRPDVALFDELSRDVYGPVVEQVRSHQGATAEIADRRIVVRGLFQLGPSMAYDGYLLTGDETFRRLLPRPAPGLIDLGLIRLAPQADPEQVAAALNAALPADVCALTREGFIEREKRFWATSTPIGYYFKAGVAMALIVGAVIVYQILYTDVSDQLAKYATLKAIGYTDAWLVQIVLAQSIFVSVLGYVPGWICGWIVVRMAAAVTRLPVQITWRHGLETLVLIVVTAAIGGALAMRRLRSADPAEIF